VGRKGTLGAAKKKSGVPQAGAELSRRAQRYRERKTRVRNRVIASVGAVLVVAAVVVVVVLSGGGSHPQPAPFVGSTVDVTLGEYVIRGDLTAPAGEVRLHAFNQGGIIHNVGVRGGHISNDVRPGGNTTVDIGNLVPGTYQLYCDIADHAQRGMVANLVVV
jgi:Cupredoxin-like domain